MTDSDGAARGRGFTALAVALGLVVGVWLTYPLVLAPGSAVLDDGTWDAFQFLWNIWWVRESLATLHNPFFTRLLFFPTRVSLVFHTFSFPLGLASVPLQALPGGVVTAHNVLVIAAPVLTVVATAWLAREVTGDRVAALAAGLVAAVNPIAVWFLPVLYLDCTYLIAFTLWAWWRLHRRRTRFDVALVVGLTATVVFASQEYGMMALALLLLDLVLRSAAPAALGMPRAWLGGAAAVWALLAVGLAALVATAAAGAASPPANVQLLLGSAYAAGFVTPPWLIPPPVPFWALIYLGTVPLVLAVVGLRDRRSWAWVVALAATLVMAMGPYLHWQHPLPTMKLPPEGLQPSGPPGPYWLALEIVPFLRWFRAPYRWVAAAQIPLAVVVAVAVAALRSRAVGPRGRAAWGAVSLAAIAAGAALDTRGLHGALVATDVPGVYDVVRDAPGRGAVLDLPSGFPTQHLGFFSSRYMYYQTRHRKPLLEGTVARLPPGTRFVWQRDIATFVPLSYVEWVVIHRDLVPQSYEVSQAQVRKIETALATEGELVVRDGPTELYRLRTFRPLP